MTTASSSSMPNGASNERPRSGEARGASHGPDAANATSAAADATSTLGEYIARSTRSIDPDEAGPVPYQLRRACRVVDIVALGGFEVQRVSFGKRTIDLEPGETVTAKLAAEPYEAGAGAYMVVTVQNRSRAAAIAEVAIRVTGENGPESTVNFFRPATAPALPLGRAMDGSPVPLEPVPMAAGADADAPRYVQARTAPFNASPAPPAKAAPPRPPPPKAPTGRRPPIPPPMPSSRSRAARAAARNRQRVITVPALSVSVEKAPPSREQVTAPQRVILFRGFAEALYSAFAYKVPLPQGYRTTIGAAFQAAGTSAETSGNEVSFELDVHDIEMISAAVWGHREAFLDNASVLASILRRTLDHVEPVADAPPEATVAAAPEAAAPSAEPSAALSSEEPPAPAKAASNAALPEGVAEDNAILTETEVSSQGILPLTQIPRLVPDDGRPE